MRDATCVIITGAAGNLARRFETKLAAEGVDLLCVKTTDALDALVSTLPSGTDLHSPQLISSSRRRSSQMVKAGVKRFGSVNALGRRFATGWVTADAFAQWDMMMTLNARVALATSIAVLPVMQAAYGALSCLARLEGRSKSGVPRRKRPSSG